MLKKEIPYERLEMSLERIAKCKRRFTDLNAYVLKSGPRNSAFLLPVEYVLNLTKARSREVIGDPSDEKELAALCPSPLGQ